LKEKAKNLAIHEDLNIVVEQLKATTEITKAIEARITTDLWNSQKRWELTKEIFIEMVKLVGRAEMTIKNAVVECEGRTKGLNRPSLLAHLGRTAFDECVDITFALDSQRLMMTLVSGRDVIPAYTKLKDAYLATVMCLDVTNFDYPRAKQLMSEFTAALVEFQFAVRKEMGIPLG
jgi:hypothetical protein